MIASFCECTLTWFPSGKHSIPKVSRGIKSLAYQRLKRASMRSAQRIQKTLKSQVRPLPMVFAPMRGSVSPTQAPIPNDTPSLVHTVSTVAPYHGTPLTAAPVGHHQNGQRARIGDVLLSGVDAGIARVPETTKIDFTMALPGWPQLSVASDCLGRAEQSKTTCKDAKGGDLCLRIHVEAFRLGRKRRSYDATSGLRVITNNWRLSGQFIARS